MKKIVSAMLLFAAIITTAVLASCGDDNDEPAKESLTGNYMGNDALGIAFAGHDYSATAGGVKYTISENKERNPQWFILQGVAVTPNFLEFGYISHNF